MSAHCTDTYKAVLAPIKRIDLAIIGGGCAGLSLARELAHRQTSQSIIVIEPRRYYQDDRSWCFWAPNHHAQEHLVSQIWPAWLFGHQDQPNEKRMSIHHPYQYIRSIDFYQDCLNSIAQCPTIETRLGESVLKVERHQDGWNIETDRNRISAAHLIDTRPPVREQFSQATLYQCFLGVELELNNGVKNDLTTIELMTDMRMLNDDFCFTYLLPMSTDRLLIELTLFSARPQSAETMQTAFNQLMDMRGYCSSRILRTESGILPMGLPADQTEIPRAGMGGGALRPSSGYGFMRIQRWAQQCADHFCAHQAILAQSGSDFLLQKMDQLFLKVLRTQPQLAPILFKQLLGQTDTERFIRFMNDRANWLDYLHIVACLPKTPFIQTLLASIFRRA